MMNQEMLLKVLSIIVIIAYLTGLVLVLHSTLGSPVAVMLVICYLVFVYKIFKEPKREN